MIYEYPVLIPFDLRFQSEWKVVGLHWYRILGTCAPYKNYYSYIVVSVYRNISIMQERMRESNNMCLTTLKFDCDILMQLKLAALEEHKSVRVIVNSLVVQYLSERSRNKRSGSTGTNSRVTGNHQLPARLFEGGIPQGEGHSYERH